MVRVLGWWAGVQVDQSVLEELKWRRRRDTGTNSDEDNGKRRERW